MNKLILRNRAKGGAAGSPTGTNYVAGEVALNFSTTPPELWTYDGTQWVRANPETLVSVASVALSGGSPGSQTGIGAAWTALASNPTASIITASFGGSTYIKTGSGGADSDWSAIGGSVPFATISETLTGTEANKAVNPVGLKGITVSDGSGVGGAAVASDAGKLVALGSNGKVSANLLPAVPVYMKGGNDFTAAPAPAFMTGLAAGDFYFADTSGTIAAGYTGITGQIHSGDAVIWSGSKFFLIPNETDLNAYLPLSGGNMLSKASKISWPAATTATPEVFLDLSGGQIDSAIIDCGVF